MPTLRELISTYRNMKPVGDTKPLENTLASIPKHCPVCGQVFKARSEIVDGRVVVHLECDHQPPIDFEEEEI